MTDLLHVLPSFRTEGYVRIIPNLERHGISVTDLLTLDVSEAARRASVPVREVESLRRDVLQGLHVSLGVFQDEGGAQAGDGGVVDHGKLQMDGTQLLNKWETISTLDDTIDAVLGGGVPRGYVTEITGESGAGKTQFLLTLLLSSQLSPTPLSTLPSTLYISTESPLPTRRLAQLLSSHPKLVSLPTEHQPRLDRVLSIPCADLEAQDHILRFQVPVAITRYNVSLIVIDSVTANFRAEFDKTTSKEKSHSSTAHGANMARRTTELGRLGMLLRDLAREHNVAVVVSNQVADRFAGTVAPAPAPAFPANWLSQEGGGQEIGVNSTPESPLAYRSAPLPMSQKRAVTGALLPSSLSQTVHPSHSPSSAAVPLPHERRQTPHRPQPQYHGDPLLIDHQQRFFTGWGGSPYTPLGESLKTPSLGLVWTEQVACRIALVKRAVYSRAGWNWYGDAVQTGKVLRDGGVAAVQSRAIGDAVGERAGGGTGTGTGKRVGPNGEGSEPLVAAGVSTGQGNEQRAPQRAENGGLALKGYTRYVNVVFSAWAAPTGAGGGDAVEYQILKEGVRSVTKDKE